MRARCRCGFQFYTEFAHCLCPACKQPIIFINQEGFAVTGLEQEIKSFADRKWPGRDLAGRLRKLGEEFGELAEAIARGEMEEAYLEAADCGIVLADLVALMGKSLTIGMMVKMEINKAKPATLSEAVEQHTRQYVDDMTREGGAA